MTNDLKTAKGAAEKVYFCVRSQINLIMVGRTRRNAPGEGAAGQATKAHDRQGKKQTKRPVTLDKEEERIEIKSKEALPEVKTKLIPFKKNVSAH